MTNTQPRALVVPDTGYGLVWKYGTKLEGAECECGNTFTYCEGRMTHRATTTTPAEYDCPNDYPLLHDPGPGCRAEGTLPECCE